MAERLVWTPADGSAAIDLTDEAAGYMWQADGTRGLRSVTYSFSAQTYAGIDGDDVQAVHADANHPSVGMLVRARNPAEFRARTRALVHAMRPKAGPGTLTVTTEDGKSRRLVCYYETGAEGDESEDTTMPGRWWKLILRFYAPMPWWLGDQRRISVGLGKGANFFPIFPLALAPSTIQGEFTVDLSDTDSPAYPVWTVTGPGSALVLTNETTGRSIEVNAALDPGEAMMIDTRPGRRSVRRLVPAPVEMVERRRNLALDPRATSAAPASFVNRWTADGSIAYLTGQSDGPNGLGSYARRTAATDTDASGRGFDHHSNPDVAEYMTAAAGARAVATPGAAHTISVWVRSSVALPVQIKARFYDAAGISASELSSSSPVALTAGTWTRLSLTATAPANAAFLAARTAYESGSLTVGVTLDGTGLLIEQAVAIDGFFDGNTADDDPLSYEWTGAAQASASVQYEAVPTGEPTPGELLMGALSSDPALWPLVDGVNRITAALTGATTKSRIGGVYEPRYAGA